MQRRRRCSKGGRSRVEIQERVESTANQNRRWTQNGKGRKEGEESWCGEGQRWDQDQASVLIHFWEEGEELLATLKGQLKAKTGTPLLGAPSLDHVQPTDVHYRHSISRLLIRRTDKAPVKLVMSNSGTTASRATIGEIVQTRNGASSCRIMQRGGSNTVTQARP